MIYDFYDTAFVTAVYSISSLSHNMSQQIHRCTEVKTKCGTGFQNKHARKKKTTAKWSPETLITAAQLCEPTRYPASPLHSRHPCHYSKNNGRSWTPQSGHNAKLKLQLRRIRRRIYRFLHSALISSVSFAAWSLRSLTSSSTPALVAAPPPEPAGAAPAVSSTFLSIKPLASLASLSIFASRDESRRRPVCLHSALISSVSFAALSFKSLMSSSTPALGAAPSPEPAGAAPAVSSTFLSIIPLASLASLSIFASRSEPRAARGLGARTT